MTAHKHAALIKAKADNMELVQFIKIGEVWEIIGHHDNKTVNFCDNYEYFLCLPQHKEACLHWLNGGEVQTDRGCGDFVDVYPLSDFSGKWCDTFWYMLDHYQSRIKPRKERRWIVVHPLSMNVEMFLDEKVCDNCMSEPMYNGYQKIEIEVEV